MKYDSLKFLLGSSVLAVAAMAGGAIDKFARMDANGDGKVTVAEHQQFAENKFKECDTNADGLLSPNESNALHADRGQAVNQETTDTHVRMVDTNSDGKISKIENDQYARNKFTAADTNKDGVLTSEEFEASHQAIKAEKKKY